MRRHPEDGAARRLQELLDRATAFTYEVDLGDELSVSPIARDVAARYALHVVKLSNGNWGIRYGEGSYYWDTGRGDWGVGSRSLGSRDRVLSLLPAVLDHHQERVREIARRAVRREEDDG
jgi:hypothetical protein